VNLYGDKQETITEINVIDQLFDEWESEIDGKIWELVKYDYDYFDIPLKHFESGEEFVSSITDYIEDEISNRDRKKVEEAGERYRLFTDSVWISKTKEEWVPVLIENQMLSEEQVDSIDVKLAEWESIIAEPGIPFGYYLLVLFALIAVLFFIVKKVKSKKAENSSE
jgi:hypothetical protein